MRALDPVLQLGRPPRSEAEVLAERLKDIRLRWRWCWERFWMLRWENQVRRPSWRIETEGQAYNAMRAIVAEYAAARGWAQEGAAS